MLGRKHTVPYVPTLALRPSEMRALEELPERDKDQFVPLILFAPWVSARKIESAVERIAKAYGNRSFIIDLDLYYEDPANLYEAQHDFRKLKDPINGYRNWIDFVASIEGAIPVLQTVNIDQETFQTQLSYVLKSSLAERGFCIRVCKSPHHSTPDAVFDTLKSVGVGNYIGIVDSGWVPDPLVEEMWFSQQLKRFAGANPQVPVVLSATSYPRDFSRFKGIHLLDIGMRQVYGNIRRNDPLSNEIRLIYGDWATTRPRERRGGGEPVPRIDYPKSNKWIVARRKNEWDYLDAAKAVRDSGEWDSELRVWGSLMVEKTAAGDIDGIDTPQKNVAARVNLHLHLQTWFDDRGAQLDTDDPWED